MDKKEEYRIKLKLAISMLKPCNCPMCDGTGVVIKEVGGNTIGFERDIDGLPIAVPCIIEDYVQEACEWCYTKEEFIKEDL